MLAAAAAEFEPTERPARPDRSLVFGTTRATNAVVTGSTARTAFLTTRATRTSFFFEKAAANEPVRLSTQQFPDPYVPRALTFEVPERMLSDGLVHRPLDEDSVRELIDRFGDGVEAVGVCFLWSIVIPHTSFASANC